MPEQEDSMEGNSDYSLSEEADTEKQSQQLVLTSTQRRRQDGGGKMSSELTRTNETGHFPPRSHHIV